MAALLIKSQAFAELDHVLLVRYFASLAMVVNQFSGTLSVGCQRRLLPDRLAKGFVYKFRGQVLHYVLDHISGLVLIHQMESPPLISAITGSRAISERIDMYSEQAAHFR